jgi:hypothetical protein
MATKKKAAKKAAKKPAKKAAKKAAKKKVISTITSARKPAASKATSRKLAKKGSKTSNSSSTPYSKADVISPEKSAASFLHNTQTQAAAPPSKFQIVIPHRPEKNYRELVSKEPATKLKRILVAQPKPEGLKSPYLI